MTKLDIIVDLQYGDSGKGKVAYFLCQKNKYTHVIRYNGGGNAGHTVFHKGKKFVTHQIPVGVFFGVRSIIGSGCALDPETFFEELHGLEKGGIKTKGLVFIARNTHIVTPAHKEEDGKETRIGTTKRGIGPTYRDKYGRTGMRAENIPVLRPYLIDLHEEFHKKNKNAVVLAEGAQGFGLDIDWGDYPYVTSSHCTSAGALLNGFPPQSVRDVWGVAKAYETYVGLKEFEPKREKIFEKIRELGKEYGATTGRARQCNWLDLQLLEKAARVNGVTKLVINKIDVLNRAGVWKIRNGLKLTSFNSPELMKTFICRYLTPIRLPAKNIFFSESAETV
ncbi:MAG: adenylosuccinate synthetase [Candidatus Taylorbacteria bacterium]|nr:adenylosuccinate synthetase [Candidatus Taylorbacteria bacterium]